MAILLLQHTKYTTLTMYWALCFTDITINPFGNPLLQGLIYLFYRLQGSDNLICPGSKCHSCLLQNLCLALYVTLIKLVQTYGFSYLYHGTAKLIRNKCLMGKKGPKEVRKIK